MEKQQLEVFPPKGSPFTVDISDKACAEFDVKHGDEVTPTDCQGCTGCELGSRPLFVIGVSPRGKSDCPCPDCQTGSKNALWVSAEKGSTKIITVFDSTEDFCKID